MTYASGGLIQATDYNGFVASVNAIWGGGSGDSGYGQSTTLATVSAGNTVAASSWSDLITRIDSMRNHQTAGAPGSGITKPVATGTITYLSTLSSQISTITTDRLLNAGDGNSVNIVTTRTNTNATGWTTTRNLEMSLTWGSAAAMRYFFNTGGYVDFDTINSAFSGNTKSTDWDTLANAFGPVRINAQNSVVSGTGYSTASTALGFYDLTTSDQLIARKYSGTVTGGYTSNFIDAYARLNAAAGSSTILYLRCLFTDNSADVLDDTVSGTAGMQINAFASGVTYITNTWSGVTGAVTIAG